MPRTYRVDLHVHTCLSPCAELDMSPRAIVEIALERGLELIAVCDHNTAANVEATRQIGRELGLSVLPGMEITTREEVHLLGLFDQSEAALDLQEMIQAHLPGRNDPDVFGLQPVVDAEGYVTGFDPHLLAGAVDLDLETLVDEVHRRGGLAVAAHVDRPAFGLLGQLGFLPPGLPLDAVEVSRNIEISEALALLGPGAPPLLRSSDAHRPEELGSAYTEMRMERPTLPELKLALQGRQDRAVERWEIV